MLHPETVFYRVPKIRENRVPRIREIGSLQVHYDSGYLTFSLKKNCPKRMVKMAICIKDLTVSFVKTLTTLPLLLFFFKNSCF